MPDKEFNLIHEPWMLVLKPDCTVEEVSLLELFRSAHKCRRLAGEIPTQDVAVLRLLLVISYSVFSRYDPDGNFAPLSSSEDALERWKVIWDKGEFPMEIIEDYLLHFEVEDRFWLFHPQHPFYQVAALDRATDYTSAKLNGELSESGNKIRLFPQRTGESKRKLRYSEAARWLLYINAYDDTSAKPKQKGLPSPGAGWLGKLGLITAVGGNLFETIMLNLVFLKDGEDKLWGIEKPIWEQPVRSSEREAIIMPDNPSELLSLQSRRLLLKREKDNVIGFALLGGDFFGKENAFAEQMTAWRNANKNKSEIPEFHPKRHDPSRQIWRDFPTLVSQGDGRRRAGIVNWISRLKREKLLSLSHTCFQIAAVKYGDKDFFIDDVFSDSITFNAGLLMALGEEWIMRIIDELNLTDKLVQSAGRLAQNLAKAAGNSEGKSQRGAAMEQVYFRLDEPFRRWLEKINPEKDEMSIICDLWWKQAQRIVRDFGEELVEQVGIKAYAGRTVMENGRMTRYTAPEAFNRFLYETSHKDMLKGGKRE